MPRTRSRLTKDPLWYKDAIIYELHVRAFKDSNGDGMGDFRGLIQRLDYLAELGITAVWLLPFFPSPLRDDGYDIQDYYGIHPSYGSPGDFKEFLKAAHARGLRVIIELVINHTSVEHKWFQRARRAKRGSNARNYYVWSDNPDKYREARIIFQDFETSNWTWDPVAQSYYWHRFYSHQPDLNFDNPNVQKAVFRMVDYWFSLGVDGMRLDAVPYLFEREGTNCENLPETHAFLKRLRAHVDRKFTDKMLLAEANQWPEDAAAYFGSGEECHMAFHFPLMPRLFMAIQMEDNFPVVDIMRSTPFIENNCQWATFLRNHDELTLEMVTDEERDYMHRTYASDRRMKINLGIRRRLAPLLGNNRRKIELMNILLMSFPGTPVIYYGDEIGMGDNYYLGDRDGVRTPMQWNTDRNAGFSTTNPQRLYLPLIVDPQYHHDAINVESQEENLSSLLWWMKRVIAMRKGFKSLCRGVMTIIRSDNPRVLSFVRSYEDESILVVANLSRFAQVVSLDLSAYAGYIPEETLSSNEFPTIGRNPYTLTLTPHGHFWFVLRRRPRQMRAYDKGLLPTLVVPGGPDEVFTGTMLYQMQVDVLPGYIVTCRWFGSKARKIRKLTVAERVPFGEGSSWASLLLLHVHYAVGESETYLLPVSYAGGHAGAVVREENPHAVIAGIRTDTEEGVLYDSTADTAFHSRLFRVIAQNRKIRGARGALAGRRGPALTGVPRKNVAAPPSRLLKVEQSNSALCYGRDEFLKLYRKLDIGTNPEVEMLRFLSDQTAFANAPAFGGTLEYRQEGREPITLAIMQGFVESDGDAWRYALDAASRYFERILGREDRSVEQAPAARSLFEVTPDDIHEDVVRLIGATNLDLMALLGRRTAEMHRALASSDAVPGFEPEPSTLLYQRSVYQSMQALVRRSFDVLEHGLSRLPTDVRRHAEDLLERQSDIRSRLRSITRSKVGGKKIRIHGDYHLGQVLRTGNDFVIMDFEGEPARPLGERKLKYSPLKDVAGMIRSFHYTAHAALFLEKRFRESDVEELMPWAEPWYYYVAGVFLAAYRDVLKDSPILPSSSGEQEMLLDVFLLEKSVYELAYEMNNRPEWVAIPIRGIQSILDKE